LGAKEAIATGDLFGEGGDQSLAVDGDVEGGMDTDQQFGDMQGGAGPLEYVVCHVNLRQTLTRPPRGRLGGAAAEAANGAQLSIERGLEYGKDRILEIIGHGGTPEYRDITQEEGRRLKVGLSI